MNCYFKASVMIATGTEVYARVVDYLRALNQWDVGKQAEWHRRKIYDVLGQYTCCARSSQDDFNR